MEKKRSTERRYCRNCYHPMPPAGDYCHHCSQKYITGKITFKELIGEFLEAVFNVDSRFFRTARALFIPGKLTEDYFLGKHKRYIHPLRIFLVLAVVHFALLSLLINNSSDLSIDEWNQRGEEDAYFGLYRDSLKSVTTLIIKESSDKDKAQAFVDQLLKKLPQKQRDSMDYGYFKLTDDWSIETDQFNVARKDLATMKAKDIIEQQNIDGFFSRLFATQVIKVNQEGGNFTKFILGKLIWMVFLMMPILGLILKLIYTRRKRFYVEHLIFSFHYHAFAFLVFSIAFLIEFCFLGSWDVLEDGLHYATGIIIIWIYLYKAMRRVYEQKSWKTFFKFIILNWAYLFIFSVAIIFTFIISLFLF